MFLSQFTIFTLQFAYLALVELSKLQYELLTNRGTPGATVRMSWKCDKRKKSLTECTILVTSA